MIEGSQLDEVHLCWLPIHCVSKKGPGHYRL